MPQRLPMCHVRSSASKSLVYFFLDRVFFYCIQQFPVKNLLCVWIGGKEVLTAAVFCERLVYRHKQPPFQEIRHVDPLIFPPIRG